MAAVHLPTPNPITDTTRLTFVPRTSGDRCYAKSPTTLRPCTRAAGHTGRHHVAWQHIDGRVREVWA